MSLRGLYGARRCVDGREMRHDPQHDDPYLETDVGQCEKCGGVGCDQEESKPVILCTCGKVLETPAAYAAHCAEAPDHFNKS